MDENEQIENEVVEQTQTGEEETGDSGATPTGVVLFDEPQEEGEEEGTDKGDQSPTFQMMRKNFNGALKDKRRLERENEELRKQLPKSTPTLGPKPTLAAFDYDEDKFQEAYDNWSEQKEALNRVEAEQLRAKRAQEEELNKFKQDYGKRSQSLGVADFAETEAEVGAMLTAEQAGLLMRGADDPAVLVYALGKSPERLIEISKIKDPVKFTAAIAKLEVTLSTKQRTRPAPEPRINSERSGGAQATNSQLDRLRDEAARTGDYTKVLQYKRDHNIK